MARAAADSQLLLSTPVNPLSRSDVGESGRSPVRDVGPTFRELLVSNGVNGTKTGLGGGQIKTDQMEGGRQRARGGGEPGGTLTGTGTGRSSTSSSLECDHVPSKGDDDDQPTTTAGSGEDEDECDDPPLKKSTYRDFSHVPPPAPENAKLVPAGKERTFPAKLHEILSNPAYEEVISWMPHGRAWRILKPEPFEDHILPLFFCHSRVSSFMRQVNGWGFRRIKSGPDYNCYYHELFLRGLPHLVDRMRRESVTSRKGAGGSKAGGNGKNGNGKAQDEEEPPDLYRWSEDHPLPELTSTGNSHAGALEPNHIVLPGQGAPGQAAGPGNARAAAAAAAQAAAAGLNPTMSPSAVLSQGGPGGGLSSLPGGPGSDPSSAAAAAAAAAGRGNPHEGGMGGLPGQGLGRGNYPGSMEAMRAAAGLPPHQSAAAMSSHFGSGGMHPELAADLEFRRALLQQQQMQRSLMMQHAHLSAGGYHPSHGGLPPDMMGMDHMGGFGGLGGMDPLAMRAAAAGLAGPGMGMGPGGMASHLAGMAGAGGGGGPLHHHLAALQQQQAEAALGRGAGVGGGGGPGGGPGGMDAGGGHLGEGSGMPQENGLGGPGGGGGLPGEAGGAGPPMPAGLYGGGRHPTDPQQTAGTGNY